MDHLDCLVYARSYSCVLSENISWRIIVHETYMHACAKILLPKPQICARTHTHTYTTRHTQRTHARRSKGVNVTSILRVGMIPWVLLMYFVWLPSSTPSMLLFVPVVALSLLQVYSQLRYAHNYAHVLSQLCSQLCPRVYQTAHDYAHKYYAQLCQLFIIGSFRHDSYTPCTFLACTCTYSA